MSDQDFRKQFTTTASPAELFEALTSVKGLAAWWADVSGDGLAGGELTFTFSPGAQAVMRVDRAEPESGVQWTNVACVEKDWVGTTIHFDFESVSGGTRLSFRHAGLTPQLECYDSCHSGWTHFVESLRLYVETGVGNPNGSDADTTRREIRDAALAG